MRPALPWLSLACVVVLAACASHQTTQREELKIVFDQTDADHDEQLDRQEFTKLPLQGVPFADVDTDQNGKVSLAELESFLIYRRVKNDGNRALKDLIRQRRY